MAILRNADSGAIVATRIERATSRVQRTIGLLARAHVEPDDGLWIEPCSAIHTLGMRARIDVIFVDAQSRVLRVCPDLRSGRWAVVCYKARATIELGSGAVQRAGVVTGDRLELITGGDELIRR